MLGYNDIMNPMMTQAGCSSCGSSGGKKRSTKTKKGGESSEFKMDAGAKKRKTRKNKRKTGGDGESENEPSNDAPTLLEGGKRRKASKNPYIIFVKKNYKSMAAKYPTLKATQIMKKISEMYKAQKK